MTERNSGGLTRNQALKLVTVQCVVGTLATLAFVGYALRSPSWYGWVLALLFLLQAVIGALSLRRLMRQG